MHKYFLLLTSLIALQSGLSQIPVGMAVVHPKEIDSVLANPGIGFNTFQRFNGDSLFPGAGWTEGSPIVYQSFTGTLANKHYPATTIAYWRVYWKFLEPAQGKYCWDLIDQALDSAKHRGQKLLLRVAPYGTGAERDVPDWYRKLVGPNTDFLYNNPVNKWVVDPEDPQYVRYFGGFIKALGERYDNHSCLYAVDLSIVGAWGEGAGSELLSRQTREALVDAYTSVFKKTPLLVMMMDEQTNKYANSREVHTGWRADCLGDLGFWAKEQNGWTHMYDFYPQAIIEYGLSDVWKKSPVSFEICGTFLNWKQVQHYDADDVRYIFSQALKWHISSFNAKSSPVPPEWEPLVNDWLKKMGYRFVLKSITYNKIINRQGLFSIRSWWENKGVAPCYIDYPLAFRLINSRYSSIIIADADIRQWLPGDNIYNKSFYLPGSMSPGKYTVQVAILDKSTRQPVVQLAIEGKEADGWYTLGAITVQP